MGSFLYNLKGQATVINGLVILLILAFFFFRYQKRIMAGWLLGIAILIFLLSSTYYLPGYLVDKLERQYTPFALEDNKLDTGRVLIIVLGSGYTLDKRLPANAQIGLCALGRLAEGIRIHRSINNSVLVCCGNSSIGLETQAQVTKRAAIVLGVDASKIETLNKPSTTQEEAKEFARLYLQTSNIILVTDAIHMPRAMKLFQMKGLDPIAAPTNYKINGGPAQEGMKWWPSLGNIGLMNYFIHEYLGKLKASIID